MPLGTPLIFMIDSDRVQFVSFFRSEEAPDVHPGLLTAKRTSQRRTI
jgi:hypothetical protein